MVDSPEGLRATTIADEVWVWERALRSPDPARLLASQHDVVTTLLSGALRPDELSQAAMRFHCLQAYARQATSNFADFVSHYRWDPRFVAYVRAALEQIGADAHLEAFRSAARVVESLRGEFLDAFLSHDSREADARFSARGRMAASVRAALERGVTAIAKVERADPLNPRIAVALRSDPQLVSLEALALRERVSSALQRISEDERRRRLAVRWEDRVRLLARTVGFELEHVVHFEALDDDHGPDGQRTIRIWFRAGGRSLVTDLRGGSAEIRSDETNEVLARGVALRSEARAARGLDWARAWTPPRMLPVPFID